MTDSPKSSNNQVPVSSKREERPKPPANQPDYSDRVTYTFTVGVYLAVNAMEDAFILVDAPDCVHMKTQYVKGNHDLQSTLTSISSFHRTANTSMHPWLIVPSREDELTGMLKQIAEHEGSGVVMITSLPMATIIGVEYDRLTRKVQSETGKTVVGVPGKALSGDWLDGYAETLNSLAKIVDISDAQPKPDNVAVIGNFMDRNEADHQANLKEMKGILSELGLNPVTIWLGGERWSDMSQVKNAAALISMPYGRRAARILGRRLSIPVVETEVPFGPQASRRWIEDVARAFGREEKVEGILDAQLKQIARQLEWAVPFYFMHKSWGYVGDPHLLPGLMDMAEELGSTVDFSVITARKAHTKELLQRHQPKNLLIEPKRMTFMKEVNAHLEKAPVDLMVANSDGFSTVASRVPAIEFGYPSFFSHAFFERPFLFFQGYLAFVERMANQIGKTGLLFRR